MTTTTRTTYNTRLCGTDADPMIELVAVQVTRIIDGAGRRQRTKEHRANADAPDVVLAKLDMAQAADLLRALASDIGFMAVPANRTADL